jgi:pyridoxamine 5'-phosphate oxidase
MQSFSSVYSFLLVFMSLTSDEFMNVGDLRQSYERGFLLEQTVNANPVLQFQGWLQDAVAAQILEPNAMTLATVTPEGKPSARIVLLKNFDDRGFVFYTNFQSRKGRELSQTPAAALVFWWERLERQVRIEGNIAKVSDAEADAYFQSRPKGSQLGAWASDQSQLIKGREDLERHLQALEQEYENRPIPRPANWGGYRLAPTVFEFWQGRPNRLHDRLCYRQNNITSWTIERLSP